MSNNALIPQVNYRQGSLVDVAQVMVRLGVDYRLDDLSLNNLADESTQVPASVTVVPMSTRFTRKIEAGKQLLNHAAVDFVAKAATYANQAKVAVLADDRATFVKPYQVATIKILGLYYHFAQLVV